MWYSVAFIFGVTLVFIACYTLIETLNFIKKGELATATIINVEVSKDLEGDNVYTPTYQFNTRSARTITYTARPSDSSSKYWLGKQVKIIFDTEDIKDRRYISYFGLFGTTVILLLTGLPLLIYGGGYFWTRSVIERLLA